MPSGRNKKVLVAMSGGVDSSVAAALLKKEGFDVVGVYMRLWRESKRGSSKIDEKRACRVAKKLGILFRVVDLKKEFKKKVVDSLIEEFKAGRTPNPCVVCNKEIKFGLLAKKLLSLDADYIATGHYIKKEKGKLLEADDKTKDQSYFLWKLNSKILKRALFPLGGYKKKKVKEMAKKFNLPVVNIPESQEICFVPDTVGDFLKRHLKARPGKVVNAKGEIIGGHKGLFFYTIGQRKGIELPGGPYYVLDKDIKKNLLVVTKRSRDLFKKELFAKNINWISGKEPKLPLRVQARIRYGHKTFSALVEKEKRGKIKVIFSRSQRAITPGQSVVFYKNEELLGGGVIL